MSFAKGGFVTNKNVLYFILIIAVGALIGSVLGEALGSVISQNSLMYRIFVKGIAPGLAPPATLNLHIVTLTFGFTININLSAVIGIVVAFLLFKRFA